METSLVDLLDRNRRHEQSLTPNHFDEVHDSQRPALVSVCCSDSRVPQDHMWTSTTDTHTPGWQFTVANIGNQTWTDPSASNPDNRTVTGDILYPLHYTETETAAIVGHTGCGAVTATLNAIEGDNATFPPGIQTRIDTLKPVIEHGLTTIEEAIDDTAARIDRLVEHNVDTQVSFLKNNAEVPEDTSIFGFVYDIHGRYGNHPGRCYLVNVDGTTALESLRDRVPTSYHDHVARLQ